MPGASGGGNDALHPEDVGIVHRGTPSFHQSLTPRGCCPLEFFMLKRGLARDVLGLDKQVSVFRACTHGFGPG